MLDFSAAFMAATAASADGKLCCFASAARERAVLVSIVNIIEIAIAAPAAFFPGLTGQGIHALNVSVNDAMIVSSAR